MADWEEDALEAALVLDEASEVRLAGHRRGRDGGARLKTAEDAVAELLVAVAETARGVNEGGFTGGGGRGGCTVDDGAADVAVGGGAGDLAVGGGAGAGVASGGARGLPRARRGGGGGSAAAAGGARCDRSRGGSVEGWVFYWTFLDRVT